MGTVATHRLIDASAVLGPADGALLNLWIHRGLDDASLARMTGMSLDSLAGRRQRIVDGLSEELGLPPTKIQEALAQLAASSPAGQATGTSSNGSSAEAGEGQRHRRVCVPRPGPIAARRRRIGLGYRACSLIRRGAGLGPAGSG